MPENTLTIAVFGAGTQRKPGALLPRHRHFCKAAISVRMAFKIAATGKATCTSGGSIISWNCQAGATRSPPKKILNDHVPASLDFYFV